jgi:hypothetical protein
MDIVCVPIMTAEEPPLVTHVAPISSMLLGAAVGMIYTEVVPDGYLTRRLPLDPSDATFPPGRVTSEPPAVTTWVPICTVDAPGVAETTFPPMVPTIVGLATATAAPVLAVGPAAPGAEEVSPLSTFTGAGVAMTAKGELEDGAGRATLEGIGVAFGIAVLAGRVATRVTALGGSEVVVYGTAVVVGNNPFTGGTAPGGSHTPIR